MWKVINGNNIDILKEYPDNHFDAIVTDPPYGIEFLGKDWDKNTGAMETWQECYRVLKPGGHMLAFSAARTYHHLATNVEMAGFEIRDQLMWLYGSGFPKAQDIGKAIERREGKRNNLINPGSDIVGLNTRCGKCGTLKNGSNENKCKDESCPLQQMTKPADNEWAGWKTALKPAHEPIVMARKPMKGSAIDNVLEWGTGALNIDESRVPYADEAEKQERLSYNKYAGKTYGDEGVYETQTTQGSVSEEGRFPSNVLGEVEGYQKFFYCPKVSRAERHAGFEQKNIPTMPTTNGNIVGNGQSKLIEREEIQSMGNNHPTVKPVELMKYLIKLVTPAGGRVLDPFNGSGSTGMAAVELGYDYVGCELDPNYVEIANKRISAWEKRFDTPANKLFD